MIPEYLIIEEKRRRERERSEHFAQLPLYAPQPEPPREVERKREDANDEPTSSVIVIDLSDFSESSL